MYLQIATPSTQPHFKKENLLNRIKLLALNVMNLRNVIYVSKKCKMAEKEHKL